jgi:hypothetical protein
MNLEAKIQISPLLTCSSSLFLSPERTLGIDQWTGGFLDTAAVDVRPEEVGIADSLPKRLDAFLQDLVSSGEIPGATLAITRYGKLVYFTSLGTISEISSRPALFLAISAYGVVSLCLRQAK